MNSASKYGYGLPEIVWTGPEHDRRGAYVYLRPARRARRALVPFLPYPYSIRLAAEDGMPMMLDFGWAFDARHLSGMLRILFEGPYGPDDEVGPRPRLIDVLTPDQTLAILRAVETVAL